MRINTQADMVKILRSEAKKAGTNISEAGATRMLEHAIESSLDPAKALKVALDGLRIPASVAKTLTAFIDGARASETRPKPVTVATQKALKEAFKTEKDSLQYKNPADAMPMGARFVRVEIARDNHVDGFTYTALIPVGALAPGAKPTDPNQATSVFIERSGGIAGLTQVAGPLDLTPQATNGRELRTLLENNDDARNALISHAWPEGYAKSTPPQLKKVSKRADGNFDVTLALVNWRSGKVADEMTLTVKPNGKLVETTGGGTQGGISADTVRDMISTLNKNMSTLNWKREDSLPVGVRYVRVDLYSERHPDGFNYTALVPAGALRPGVEPDLSNVTSYFVERTGGFAGMTRVAGPITIEQSTGGGATTMAIGEEGGDGGGTVTTMAVGEEGGDGGGTVTTMAVGEEGGDGGLNPQQAKVDALWSKIQKVHGRLTEELRTEDAIRSLDVVDGKLVATWDPRGPFTQNQVKAFMTQAMQAAGITLPLVLERDQIMTTMAVGEEGQGGGGGGGQVTTLAMGEEGQGGIGGGGGNVTTAAIGEEGGGGGMVTMAIPESPDGGIGGGGATTMAVGEEGGGGGMVTMAIPESPDSGIGVTTMAVGEEGQGGMGGVKQKVDALWKEIQKVHGRMTEELRTEDAVRGVAFTDGSVVVTWDPRGPFSQNQVKAFMQAKLQEKGITAPLVLEREQIMTTMAVGEEGQGPGGGGTVTTMAVGEEGQDPIGGGGGGRVTTMAVGEEGQGGVGGGGRVTTEAVGEEGQGGGGGRVTTMAVGEEGTGGGRGGITTEAVGEES
jgi:hypothetical protein